jgi:UDP-N-acetylglucosamine acyltransferase
MASSHVAHDCSLGDNVVLANAALLAGHVSVGDNTFVGGVRPCTSSAASVTA